MFVIESAITPITNPEKAPDINFAGVIECAKEKGIDVFIVEQDESEDALVSAKISIDNLRKLI